MRARLCPHAGARSGVALPDLTTDGGPDFHLPMQVALRHAPKQIFEALRPRRDRGRDQAALRDRDVHDRALADPDVRGEGLRDSQRKTIAPFLNWHAHGPRLLIERRIYKEDTSPAWEIQA